MMTEYQREMVDYVKANHPCYPRRKHAKMNLEDLQVLEQQADAVAMAWLDKSIPWWRDGNPPIPNKVYVTVGKDDENEDDEY